MLLHLTGNRRRTVAQSMIAALVATWLSLVCQQCLAYARDTQSAPAGHDHGAHCMAPAADDTAPMTGHSSCTSGCNCSAMVAAATVSPPKSLPFVSVSDPIDLPPAPVNHVAIAAFGTPAAVPRPPKGVTTHLLERFCIHLE